MDYESNFDSVLKEFIKIKPSFKESLSPVSEKGLNLGKQILFLKLKKQKIFKKTKYILLLPQYISWIFSGKYSSEISYLGNHTHLWNFKKKSYSSFAKRLKIQNKFPKINSAWKTLGSYSLDQRLKDDKIKIINGIHDSDASYLLFIKSKFKKFNLISSGTQIVTMNASTSSKYLKDGKEMYGGINIFGKTVPTIRFMGGREYEFLKQKLKINKKYEKFEPSFFSKEKFLYPSYGVGGPFSKMKGNYINFIKENGNIRYMAIITYISFVLNYSMDLLKCKDSIIITGPLIHNHNILKILNSLRGKQKIYLSSNQEGTGLGASLLFDLKKKINLDFKLFNSKKIPEINSSYQHWVKKIIN
jgi:sugar (pentulose or hexulose) kinase